MLKKAVFLVLLLPMSFGFLYAQSYQLELSTDKDQIDINDTLKLEVTMKQNNNTNVANPEISGLENFNIVSRANSSSIRIINNDVSMLYSLVYELQAKNKGTYTIGPAIMKVGTGTIVSNKVQVTVKGEKVFINGLPSGLNTSGNQEQAKENTNSPPQTNDNNDTSTSLTQDNQPSASSYMSKYTIGGILILIVLLSSILYRLWKNESFDKTEQADNKEKEKTNEIEKEIKLNLPKINDPEFKTKIQSYVVQSLKTKYDLDLGTTTYSRIVEKLKGVEKNKIYLEYYKDLFDRLSLLKFGDIDEYKNEIISILKKLD